MTSGNTWPVSLLAISVAGLIAWDVIGRDRRPPDPPPPPRLLDARVILIADAIASAEGYYAPGEHAGHSLLYRLNNPGGLKKPALGADGLPTWKDTGIVHFPTIEMGWTALRHQVRGMVSGTSRVYQPSDTIAAVAQKYAEGDSNWAVHVATKLGVTPTVTVAELAASR